MLRLAPSPVFALVFFAASTAFSAPSAAPVAAPPAGPPPPAATFAKRKRHAQRREVVPDDVLALLPWQGIYAAGGGLSSPSWRVVVTLQGDLRAGSNSRPGSSSTALVDKKRTKIGGEVLAQLVALADAAWRERPARPAPPSADYGEILVVADGADVFLLDPKGPITAGPAAQLLARLKAAAAAP
jgi:hypothetical protein